MPKGEGWFIDLETGEHVRIYEHRAAVETDPAHYRVRLDEIAGKGRDEILSLVMTRGFVRVRADREWIVFEFNAPARRVLHIIREFLEANGFVGYRQVRLKDHRKRRTLECTADNFLGGKASTWVSWSHQSDTRQVPQSAL